MVIRGVGGILMKLLDGMRVVYGNMLGRVEEFSRYTRSEVDDSSKISFWHDVGINP